LTERRTHAPRGLAGGADGEPGWNVIDGEPVPAKTTRTVSAGTTVRIETPSGGGHGPPADESDESGDGESEKSDA
jgi:N-methylhydantoinase B